MAVRTNAPNKQVNRYSLLTKYGWLIFNLKVRIEKYYDFSIFLNIFKTKYDSWNVYSDYSSAEECATLTDIAFLKISEKPMVRSINERPAYDCTIFMLTFILKSRVQWLHSNQSKDQVVRRTVIC